MCILSRAVAQINIVDICNRWLKVKCGFVLRVCQMAFPLVVVLWPFFSDFILLLYITCRKRTQANRMEYNHQ